MELLINPPLPTALDNTKIDSFLVCEMKFFWEHLQGVKLKTPSIHLQFGQAFHAAVEQWHITGDVTKAKEIFTAVMEGAVFHTNKNLDHGLAIIEEYAKHHSSSTWTPLIQDENHKTELSFALPLMDELLYVGKIDMVIKLNDHTMFVDHKTTSQLGASYFNGIKPNRQFAGYHWALDHYYPTYGGLINAIFIGKPKALTVKQQKDIEVTRIALGDEAANEEYRFASVNTKFANEIVTFSKHDIQEWETNTKKIVGCMRDTHRDNSWIKNSHSCNYYGLCPYHSLCIEPRSFMDIQPNDAMYERRFWNPLAEEGEEN